MRNPSTYLAVLVLGILMVTTGCQTHEGDNFPGGLNLGYVSGISKVDYKPQWLHAGPIRVKLQDGELRYLYVGDKEIVRRIYFAVRNANWDTAMPKFTTLTVHKADDHFSVKLAADCKMGDVDYSWTGTITGTADGKITFTATGTPNADFDSNRIGLCVLFGVPSLQIQDFTTDGQPASGQFPLFVSPTHVADQFHKLKYATPGGMNVSCQLEGAIFDMEDQRNWGDSSWKAFAPLPYAYTHVTKGDVKTQTATIAVSGTVDAKAASQDGVHVRIVHVATGLHIPALVAPPEGKIDEFTPISFNRDKYKDAKEIAWSYIPTTHLPDEDTIMENLPAVAYQACTVQSFNDGCAMRVGPIGLSHAGSKDPRVNSPLAAAWAVGMIKYLALGSVKEASFALGGGAPAAALDAVRPYAQKQYLAVETDPVDAQHLVTFAAENDKGVGLFLVNTTAATCHTEIAGLPAKQVHILHVGGNEQPADVAAGTLKVELAPYDVVRVTIQK